MQASIDEAVPKLSHLAQNGTEFVRPFASEALAGMRTEKALKELEKLGLDSRDTYELDVNAHNRERANWL
jgi:HEAT repeat protein